MSKIFKLTIKRIYLVLIFISLLLVLLLSGCNGSSEVKTNSGEDLNKNISEVNKPDLSKYHKVNTVIEDHMLEDSIKKELVPHEKVLQLLKSKSSFDDIYKEYSKSEYYIPLNKSDYMVSFLNKITNNTIIYKDIYDENKDILGYIEIHSTGSDMMTGFDNEVEMEKYYDTLYDNKETDQNATGDRLLTWSSKDGHIIGLTTLCEPDSLIFQVSTVIIYDK